MAEFGLAKASGVMDVMPIVPSTLLGEIELLDWPVIMDSEPTLPVIKGASAPRLMIPVQKRQESFKESASKNKCVFHWSIKNGCLPGWCIPGPSCILGAEAGGGGG